MPYLLRYAFPLGLIASAASMDANAALPPLSTLISRYIDWPPPTHELILFGSLVLLSVALVMRIVRQHEEREFSVFADRPDMRWWKNP